MTDWTVLQTKKVVDDGIERIIIFKTKKGTCVSVTKAAYGDLTIFLYSYYVHIIGTTKERKWSKEIKQTFAEKMEGNENHMFFV